jgi:hypothetical protein
MDPAANTAVKQPTRTEATSMGFTVRFDEIAERGQRCKIRKSPEDKCNGEADQQSARSAVPAQPYAQIAKSEPSQRNEKNNSQPWIGLCHLHNRSADRDRSGYADFFSPTLQPLIFANAAAA